MYSPVRPPWILRKYYSRFVWSMPAGGKNIYLTFDDGPVPGVTDFVLQQLQHFQMKATFFCVGDNVRKHPELFQKIKDEGHRIGNHTFHHMNGWENNTADYIDNIAKANEYIGSNLFRPPYGRIRKQQSESVLKNYKIIMWDVLSYDFNHQVTPEKCYRNVINNTRPGSIILFHDSVKAFINLEYALPKCLDYFKQEGYTAEVL